MVHTTEDRKEAQPRSPQASTKSPQKPGGQRLPQDPRGAGRSRPPGRRLANAAWFILGLELGTLLYSFVIGVAIALRIESDIPVDIWELRLAMLILIVPPIAALPVALQAARWGSESGKVALAVAAVLLIAVVALMIYNGVIELVIPCLLFTGMLLWGVWLFASKPSSAKAEDMR